LRGGKQRLKSKELWEELGKIVKVRDKEKKGWKGQENESCKKANSVLEERELFGQQTTLQLWKLDCHSKYIPNLTDHWMQPPNRKLYAKSLNQKGKLQKRIITNKGPIVFKAYTG
jgi:hypothetical protein